MNDSKMRSTRSFGPAVAAKKVAGEMWPDKSQREAHNLMDACLNPERRERFSPAQVLYLAKRGSQVGCHAILMFLASECGYEVKPITEVTGLAAASLPQGPCGLPGSTPATNEERT